MKTGKTGISSVTHLSPDKRKRIAKARKKEEARWASKCGPVIVKRIREEGT